MKFVTVFNNKEINSMLHPMVVVESWRNVMTCGSKRKEYESTFNEKQRKIIKKNYKKYVGWCLGINSNGIPENHTMPIHEVELMSKVASFFATI